MWVTKHKYKILFQVPNLTKWQFTYGSVAGTNMYQTTAKQSKEEPGIHADLENRESF